MFNFNNKKKRVDVAQIVFRSPNQQADAPSQQPVFPPRRESVSKSFIALLSVFFLVAVAAYFLYAGEDKEGNILSTSKPIKAEASNYPQSEAESISQRDSLLTGINNAETSDNGEPSDDSVPDPNVSASTNLDDVTTGEVKSTSGNTVSRTTGSSTRTYSSNSNSVKKEETDEQTTFKTQYKVLSKAHFYSKPSHKSRLNSSISRWKKSYAPLNALDEKNGFIYVVFTDDQNKTSEGWLRKKDVKPVKTAMYASDSK